MKQQRMNVQTVAEILIEELDKLEKTAASIQKSVEDAKKTLPAIGNQLTRIEQTKVKVDTSAMEAILRRFEGLSQERIYLPRWIIIVLLVLSVATSGLIFYTWHQSNKLFRIENERDAYGQYIQESQQAGAFHDWLEQK